MAVERKVWIHNKDQKEEENGKILCLIKDDDKSDEYFIVELLNDTSFKRIPKDEIKKDPYYFGKLIRENEKMDHAFIILDDDLNLRFHKIKDNGSIVEEINEEDSLYKEPLIFTKKND